MWVQVLEKILYVLFCLTTYTAAGAVALVHSPCGKLTVNLVGWPSGTPEMSPTFAS